MQNKVENSYAKTPTLKTESFLKTITIILFVLQISLIVLVMICSTAFCKAEKNGPFSQWSKCAQNLSFSENLFKDYLSVHSCDPKFLKLRESIDGTHYIIFVNLSS